MEIRWLCCFFFLTGVSTMWGSEQADCAAPRLSDQRIKEIIANERAARKDLPRPFPQFNSEVRRHGCYYVYAEYPIPATPERHYIFKLNQQGSIVDVEPGDPKCPDKVFTQAELAEIVKNARAKRPDVPAAFPQSRTRVERVRCLYQYFEYSLPERRGNYQVFTIDPFGEVMDVIRPDPY